MSDRFSNQPRRPASTTGSDSSSESLCPICKDARSQDFARLMPCGHEFDLECVKMIMDDYLLRDKCPVCRTRPTEVRYAVTKDGSCRTYIPGSYPRLASSNAGGRQGIRDAMSGALQDASQQTQPPATPAQIQRSLETQSLQQLPIYEPDVWATPWEEAYMTEGQNYIIARRRTCLALTQRQIGTATVLKRYLVIQTVPIAASHVTFELSQPQKPAEVQKARADIEAALSSLGARVSDPLAVLTLEGPEMTLLTDPKGLLVSTSKIMKVTLKFDSGITETNIPSAMILEHKTSLEEMLPANIGSDNRERERNVNVGGFGYEERERAVRLARMEIQGALETVMPYAEDFEQLEEAITGILDAVPPPS